MATHDYKARITFQGVSGMPTDVYCNDFSVRADDADLALVAVDLISFYTTDFAGEINGPLGGYLSDIVSRAADAVSVELTRRISGGPDGAPEYVTTFTCPATNAGSGPEPAEVAVCLTMHADLSGSVNKKRRRGRIFVGPLLVGYTLLDGGHVLVDPDLTNDMAVAASGLLTTSIASGWEWDVWSTADGVGRPVVGGWVDDGWDTLRSRSSAAVTRRLWT